MALSEAEEESLGLLLRCLHLVSVSAEGDG